MLFKVNYQFQVRVQEKSTTFRVHLSVEKDDIPRFHNLVNSIKRASKHLIVNDFYIVFECNNRKLIVHDDITLHRMLSNEHNEPLDLILYQKPKSWSHDFSEPTASQHTRANSTPDNVPAFQSIASQWKPMPPPPTTATASLATASSSQIQAPKANTFRKDSGVCLEDGPVKKKHRVMSAEAAMHHRKLPHPPALRAPNTSRMHPFESCPTTLSPRLMPPITSVPPMTKVTLPAISSITGFPDESSHQTHQTTTTNTTNTGTAERQHNLFTCKKVIDSTTGRLCGQTFRRSYDLSRHQTIHLKERPYCYCDHCGKRFTRMDALRRHERVQGHTSPDNVNRRRPNTHPSLGEPRPLQFSNAHVKIAPNRSTRV